MDLIKRLCKEHAALQKDPLEGCTAGPVSDEDPYQWAGFISGPQNTPYANGTFKLSIRFPQDYPRSPPEVTVTTPIFHPNISSQGKVRLAELEQTSWSLAFTVKTVLISLQALLSDPNVQAGCGSNKEAEELYLKDRKAFEERARQSTLSRAFDSGDSEQEPGAGDAK